MSAGPLTDTVISLNLPMVTAVNYARENFMMEFGLSDMLATVEVGTLCSRVDILTFCTHLIGSEDNVDILVLLVNLVLNYLMYVQLLEYCHA